MRCRSGEWGDDEKEVGRCCATSTTSTHQAINMLVFNRCSTYLTYSESGKEGLWVEFLRSCAVKVGLTGIDTGMPEGVGVVGVVVTMGEGV